MEVRENWERTVIDLVEIWKQVTVVGKKKR